jgi:hypothetical protein
MTPIEKTLSEAIGNLFKNKDSNLGTVGHIEYANTMNFQRELIEDMFALKTADSNFHEELCGAFHDIHSYKYLEDATFAVALNKRLTSRGVPTEEIQKAVKFVEEIKKELGGDTFQEKESGWHPELADILDTTRNATTRKPKYNAPYSGGGPAPKKNEIK